MRNVFILLIVVFFIGCSSEGGGGGDGVLSFKYKEGDNVYIMRNATKSTINIYKGFVETLAAKKGVILLSKALELETCETFGFEYKNNSTEDNLVLKSFVKGEKTCTEKRITDDALIGTEGIIILLRK